jgi:hypothetical protein
MEAKTISIEEAALLDTNSDDVYGLWEVDWWFNGSHPTWEKGQRIDLLCSVVNRQLVDVFFGKMGTDLVPLPIGAALKAVRNWENWSPREHIVQPVYHVMTNDAGLLALRAHMAGK